MADKQHRNTPRQFDAEGHRINPGQVFRYGDTITAKVLSVGFKKIRMEFKQDGVPKSWTKPVSTPLPEQFKLIKDV